jgi:uncharacterized damage-inducible protein DinB
MKYILFLLTLVLSSSAHAQTNTNKEATLKSALLEQLRSSHNQKDWFVSVNDALAGLTPEQASWKDTSGNHSIGQLANHLLFWDTDQLARFKGEEPPKYGGKNDETFNNFDSKNWPAIVKQLDAVLTELEKAVEAADDKKIREWAPALLGHVAAHNAYHVGQIIYVRRLQGSWNPENGVK